MGIEEKIQKILEYAIWAPSGDNTQPWRFKIQGPQVYFYLNPDADNKFLNFKLGGTLISCGCAIENICVASVGFGLQANIELQDENPDFLVAIILFQEVVKDELVEHELFKVIKERCTNRNFYKNARLDEAEKRYLLESNQKNLEYFKIYENDSDRKTLGKFGADAEIIILENRQLHNLLFEDIIWTEKQELSKHKGLYIKTMEFNPIQKLLFYLASHWPIMRILIRLGFAKFVAKEDAYKYSTGSFIGTIEAKGNSWSDFVNSGRLFQNVWLRATKLGLALQPLIANIFLIKSWKENKNFMELSQEHISILAQSEVNLNSVVGAGKNLHILFRCGYSKPASARSSRFSVLHFIK